MSDLHVIEFRDNGWGLEHPDACRADGKSLLDCEHHKAVTEAAEGWDDAPAEYGRYVLTIRRTGELQFTARLLGDETEDATMSGGSAP